CLLLILLSLETRQCLLTSYLSEIQWILQISRLSSRQWILESWICSLQVIR
ncbi:hypothetical protein I314_03231, partial [Cryptococcus bacillisporus CA1873]